MSPFAPRGGATIVLLALLALLAACGKEAPPPDPVRPVKLARAIAGDAQAASVFAGEVKPRHESDLGFRIGGKLVARLVDTGATVKRGQPLARLDAADVALNADAAKAAVAAADTEYRYAKAEFERYENLQAQKFVSGSALDQKRNQMNATAAKLDQARAQLDVARNQAGYATLVADTDGVVTAVLAEPGQVVASGQAVVRVARTGEREVAIAVPENRIGELRAARDPLVILWANPERPYAARVREVAPSVDAATRTFAVRLSILDPDDTVQWGMTANVVLRGGASSTTVFVPSASILRGEDGQPAVWVYDAAKGTVAPRAVALAGFREDGALVASGLRAGEFIVAAGAHKLVPGQRVEPWAGGEKPSTTAAARP